MAATYVLTIAGVQKNLQVGSLQIRESANGVNTISFDVLSRDGSYSPAMDAEVILTENGSRIFGGRINAPAKSRPNNGIGGSGILTRVSAHDFNEFASRRYINGTIPAGTMKSQLQIIVTYLDGPYGVSLDAAQVDGPNIPEIVCDFTRIDELLTKIVELASQIAGSGYYWEIDYDKELRIAEASSVAAPFNVTDTNGTTVGNISVEPTRADYANKIYGRFNNAAVNAYAHLDATANLSNGETVTMGSRTYTFQTVLTNVNGNVLIGSDLEESLYHLAAALSADVGSGTIFAAATTENTQVFASAWGATRLTVKAHTAGASGNSIGVSETAANASWITEGGGSTSNLDFGADAALSNVVQAQDDAEIASDAKLKERVETYADVYSVELAQAFAEASLAIAILEQQKVTYTTRRTGIRPGMTQTITHAGLGLSGTFVVSEVSTSGNARFTERRVVALSGTTAVLPDRDTVQSWGGGSSSRSTAIAAIIGSGSGSSGSGGGIGGSGTTGKIPKFSGSATLTDSILSESSGSITLAGVLDVNGFGTHLFNSGGTGGQTVRVRNTTAGTGNYAWVAVGNDANDSLTGLYAMSSTYTTSAQFVANGSVLQGVGAGGLSLAATGGALRMYWSGTTLKLQGSGSDLTPGSNYTINLGSLSSKFLTLHAAELWVETLVAQNTMATIGGRVLVAPTNILTADLATGTTTLTVKYNNLANGDRVYLEADGKVEWMAVTSGAGGSAGAYTYTVTRNLDGSGANVWFSGDAVLNTGTTGDGFIDLYSTSGVLSGTGPTIVGNVRTGTTYNNIAARWAIGNLNGLYGYGSDEYGAAFGNASAAHILIDATNGIRIRHSSTDKITLDASGNAAFSGSVTATAGFIGGWAIAAGQLNATNMALVSGAAGTARVQVGTGSDESGIVSTSAGSDIAFWSGIGFASRASAPFRVTAAGDLVATSATITGSITSTSGTIGGWTINSTSLTGGNATLAASGNLTLGTGDDVVRLSADDGTYRLWIGHATAASAPFRVGKTGGFVATNAVITGDITANTLDANGGTIGSLTVDGTLTVGGGGSVVAGGVSLTSAGLSLNAGDITITAANGIVIGSGAATGSKRIQLGSFTLYGTGSRFFMDAGLTLDGGVIVNNSGVAGFVQASEFLVGDVIEFVNIGANTGTTVVWSSGDGSFYKDSSSIRYKENVAPWAPDSRVASLFAQVRPITFDYKAARAAKGVLGFAAEDLALIDPRLVNLDKDGLPESVRVQALIAYLFEAVRELRARA
jgi:hypothetical protein